MKIKYFIYSFSNHAIAGIGLGFYHKRNGTLKIIRNVETRKKIKSIVEAKNSHRPGLKLVSASPSPSPPVLVYHGLAVAAIFALFIVNSFNSSGVGFMNSTVITL